MLGIAQVLALHAYPPFEALLLSPIPLYKPCSFPSCQLYPSQPSSTRVQLIPSIRSPGSKIFISRTSFEFLSQAPSSFSSSMAHPISSPISYALESKFLVVLIPHSRSSKQSCRQASTSSSAWTSFEQQAQSSTGPRPVWTLKHQLLQQSPLPAHFEPPLQFRGSLRTSFGWLQQLRTSKKVR